MKTQGHGWPALPLGTETLLKCPCPGSACPPMAWRTSWRQNSVELRDSCANQGLLLLEDSRGLDQRYWRTLRHQCGLNPTSAGLAGSRRQFASASSASRQAAAKRFRNSSPVRSLVEPLPKKAGRNHTGQITIRHRGGGHKRSYRIIDFRRQAKDGVSATVSGIEYDPNRTARIALLNFPDGKQSYVLAARGVAAGDQLATGPDADIQPGNTLPLANIPVGTTVHAIELRPGGGAQLARSAGTSAQLMRKEGKLAQLRLPSSEVRNVDVRCRATVGEVGYAERSNVKWRKAGQRRWLGWRPTVRGVAMNPVDHPHGGGEGRTSGGRHPVNPSGKCEGRTRRPKPSDALILRRRKSKK